SVVRLTEAREKALNVVLNNQEAQSRYEPGKLGELLTELADLPELGMTGFDHGTLAALHLEPADLPPLPPLEQPDCVEITLGRDSATYAKRPPALDKVVGEYDLVAHVRGG